MQTSLDFYQHSNNTIILFATQNKNDNTAVHRTPAMSGGLARFLSGKLNIKLESAV